MLTRRFPPFTTLACGLSTVLMLSSACVSIVDDGDSAGDETDTNADNADTNADSNDTSNDSSGACDDACATLESCGFPSDQCVALCGSDECATCLAASDQCGADCQEACTGSTTGDGDGDPTGDGDGDPSGDGDGDGDVPPTECINDGDCGLSFECVTCGLNDPEGWCEQTSPCTFSEDCGFGGFCGYNVETDDYRCLPASYCE